MTRAAIVLASLLLAATPAAAKISEQGGELYSIEKRDILGHHEISAALGTLPMDAFGKGLSLYGSYSYHFSQLIGWEIVGGMWAFNMDTGLRDELRERFEVQPTDEEELKWILNSNFIFKPLYGKFALANNRLFSGELAFLAGYALAGKTASVPSGIDVGVSIRMFFGRYFSTRLDIRDYMLFPGFSGFENHLYVSLGLALTFGFADDEEVAR